MTILLGTGTQSKYLLDVDVDPDVAMELGF
jgi:hypothetical protein